MLEWGGEEETLIEIENTTGITPKGLQNKPDLKPALVPIWAIFCLIGSCRSYTETRPNPIPLVDIKAYLDITEESSVESRLYFIKLIKILDRMYLTDWADKAERDRQAKR